MDAQREQNNMTFLCPNKKNCNAVTTIHDRQQPAIATAANNFNSGYSFLALLHNLLSSPGFNDAITWQPHGKSFSVIDQQRFTLMVVMPVGFNMTLDDFYKSLDMWGFKRCLMPSAGPDQCAYYHALFLRDKPELIGEMAPKKINESNFYEKSVDSISSGYHNLLRHGYVSGIHPLLPNSKEVYPSSDAHVQHLVVPSAARQSFQLMASPAVAYCEQCTQTDFSNHASAPQGNADRSGGGGDAKLGSSTAPLVQDPRYVTPPRQSFQGMASPFLSGSPSKKVQAPMPDKVQEKGALLVEANQPLGSSSTTAFTAAPHAAAADQITLFDVSSTSCKKSTNANVDLTQEAKSITTKTCQPGGAALRSRSNSFQPIAEARPATKEVVHPMVLNNDELKLLFCFLSSPDGDGRNVNHLITPDTEADKGETKPSQKDEKKKAALHGLYQQARDKSRDNKRKREDEVQCGQKQDSRGLAAAIATRHEEYAKRMKQAKPMCLHGEGCTNPSVEGKGGLCIGHWHEEEMRLKEYQQFYFS